MDDIIVELRGVHIYMGRRNFFSIIDDDGYGGILALEVTVIGPSFVTPDHQPTQLTRCGGGLWMWMCDLRVECCTSTAGIKRKKKPLPCLCARNLEL